MTTGEEDGRYVRRCLENLASDLEDRGFETQVIEASGSPSISIRNRVAPKLSENINAAIADDGSWWLWWSWGDRIARIDDVETAGFKIAYVLTPHATADQAQVRGA